MYNRVFTLFTLFLGVLISCYGQLLIDESEVSSKTIVKFYGEFSGCSVVEWKRLAENDSFEYFVTFTQGLNKVQAWLDSKGNVIKESAEGKSIPNPMMQVLDEKYGSYKIKAIKYKKDHKSGVASYRLTLKTKIHGEFDLNLDQDFTIVDNKSIIAYK